MNKHHRVTPLSLWLEWNKAFLEMWDLTVVPWMKTEALAQVLGRGMESYLLMDSASNGIVRTSIEEAHHMNVAWASMFSPKVGQTPRTRIWTKNKAQLYRYDRPTQVPVQYRTPLLIVYALINKPFILDLIPQRSFVGYMVNRGIDVYLLDWGIPGPEDKHLCFDDLVIEYLPQVVQQVLEVAGEERLHMLGYCIGGILATLYAAMHPNAPLSSMILLATPVDFSNADVLGTWLNPRYFDVDKLVDAMGNIPPAFIFAGARLLSLAGAPAMFEEFATDEQASEVWRAISLWAIDGVPFPGEAFRQLVKDFYQSNKLINDQLTLASKPVHLSNITIPILNVSAQEDHLVPLSQIKTLFNKISSTEKELVIVPGSHFALAIGQQAVSNLWPRELDWLARHSRI
jgi:polyhydroxyalkanoate synthase